MFVANVGSESKAVSGYIEGPLCWQRSDQETQVLKGVQ